MDTVTLDIAELKDVQKDILFCRKYKILHIICIFMYLNNNTVQPVGHLSVFICNITKLQVGYSKNNLPMKAYMAAILKNACTNKEMG